MKDRIAFHAIALLILLASHTTYAYIGYRIGEQAGSFRGRHEQQMEADLPSRNEIINLTELCRP